MFRLALRVPRKCYRQARFYRVLALESSCDDACVALLEKSQNQPPKVIDQVKKTLQSAQLGGIMPTAAHDFHHATVGPLVAEFCQKHGLNSTNPPDLICCTRGPGMTGSLSSSIQLSKGLAMAWNVPLVGVHHMLGHILVSQLPKKAQPDIPQPKYPFLSLLCSGGHTMLVLSKSLAEHEIIVDINDIAAGDALDKCARELGLYGNMLGKEMEKYVNSIPDRTRDEFDKINTRSRSRNDDEHPLKISLPFKGPRDAKFPETIQFSFASFRSSIQSYRKQHCNDQAFDERTNQLIAYKIQESIFDHIVDRINLALTMHGTDRNSYSEVSCKFEGVQDFICSGGVAANQRLRQKLSSELKFKERLGPDTEMTFHFPDLDLCTDNAIMIGVAGIETFEGLRMKTDLSMRAIRRWPLDQLLEVESWEKVSDEEFEKVTKY